MANVRNGDLLTKDLTEGDYLVKADTSSWGDLLHETEFEVVKIGATRLTLRHRYGLAEIQVIVKDGVVTERIYGKADRWHDRAEIHTPDDERLAFLREQKRVNELKGDANKKTKVWLSNGSDPSAARNAAKALTKYAKARDALDARREAL